MEVKTWGERWHEEMPRSRDNRCPTCSDGTLWKLTFKNVQEHLVGLDDRNDIYKITAIFKCPNCESLFWFHLDKIFAEWALEDVDEK